MYTVVSGDTLTAIAARFNTTIPAILKLNPFIKNPDLIRVGDRIRVR
jgi:peptidoglycan endopeptidase LytE